jgi:nitroreductase
MKQYLEKRITTRWWTDKPVEKEYLDVLLETAYLSPSKQNCYEWRCIVLTDSEKGKQIKKDLYENHAWSDSNLVMNGNAEGPKRYNGQYLAPLLFVWVTRFLEINLNNDRYAPERKNSGRRDIHVCLNAGICAGAIMTAAEDIGLNTGFGQCHDSEKLAEIVGYPGEYGIVVLGVGYGEEHMYIPDHKLSVNRTKNVIINGKVEGTDDINVPVNVKSTNMRVRKPSKETLIQLV